MSDEPSEPTLGDHARYVLIEETIKVILTISWKRIEQWLHDRDRHRSGEARREFFERFDKALSPQEEETDEDDEAAI